MCRACECVCPRSLPLCRIVCGDATKLPQKHILERVIVCIKQSYMLLAMSMPLPLPLLPLTASRLGIDKYWFILPTAKLPFAVDAESVSVQRNASVWISVLNQMHTLATPLPFADVQRVRAVYHLIDEYIFLTSTAIEHGIFTCRPHRRVSAVGVRLWHAVKAPTTCRTSFRRTNLHYLLILLALPSPPPPSSSSSTSLATWRKASTSTLAH